MNYINYLSSGKIGDLIFNLSVINEIYLNTGRKGILYLTNSPEKFHYSLEKAYNDIYKIVKSQEYIFDFIIFNNQCKIDVNLDEWRNKEYLNSLNWIEIYNKTYEEYNIQWGKHKWITLPKDEKFKDCIFVFHSNRRLNRDVSLKNFIKNHQKKVYFVTTDINDYYYFRNILKCECMLFQNLYEYCVAINSCHIMISNMSFPLCISLALGIDVIAIYPNEGFDKLRGMGLEKLFIGLDCIYNKSEYTSNKILEYIHLN